MVHSYGCEPLKLFPVLSHPSDTCSLLNTKWARSEKASQLSDKFSISLKYLSPFLPLTTPMLSLLGVPSSKKPSQAAMWLRLWLLGFRQPWTAISWLSPKPDCGLLKSRNGLLSVSLSPPRLV